MKELYYSRQLKGYEGTYFEVIKKKHILSKPYYVFNLYVGGKHKLKNVLDYSTSEYSFEYANKAIQLYNSLFNIIEYPLVIYLTENLKKEIKAFVKSQLFSDIFRSYNVYCDFRRTNQGYTLEEETIVGNRKEFCKIKMEGSRTLIQCREEYYEEKLGGINVNQYVSRNIGDFILCILKLMYYHYIFFLRKEDKYFSYPISQEIHSQFYYRDFEFAAEYIIIRFFNEEMDEIPRERQYDNLLLFNYPFKISIVR